MSHEAGTRTGREKLVYMANQIATLRLESQPGKSAGRRHCQGTSNEFWRPAQCEPTVFENRRSWRSGLKPEVIEAASAMPACRAAQTIPAAHRLTKRAGLRNGPPTRPADALGVVRGGSAGPCPLNLNMRRAKTRPFR